MARKIPLSARFCETVTATGRHGDGRGGHGLQLNVKPMKNGRISKSWVQHIRIGETYTNIGLGSYPIVSLARAREIALDNVVMASKGLDPRQGGILTLAEAIESVIELDGPRWKGGAHGRSASQWRSSLNDHIPAKTRSTRIDRITTRELFTALSKIWYEKPTTAKRIRQRLGRIFDWSVSKNYRVTNPATSALMAGLRKPTTKKKHFRFLPFDQVSNALEEIRKCDADQGVRLAFEFLILTAARSGEVLAAIWNEFDLDAATWTIPAERMKAGEAHTQPLSTAAIVVLNEAREASNGEGLVFTRKDGGRIESAYLPRLLGRLKLDATAHGFRTTWRTWATDRARLPEATIERQLAHKNPNEAVAAYDRSQRLTERRECMERWGAYVTRRSGEVIKIGQAR